MTVKNTASKLSKAIIILGIYINTSSQFIYTGNCGYGDAVFQIWKGIVRAYTSVDGKEITFWVGKEGATIVSMKGYVNDEPGYETMELMEDSVLYVLERKKLKELFSEDLHIANWGRRYAEMELLATEERLISMLSAIASERYKELLEKEPDLLQRLPLGNIATYLGITQASLSRIRAQIK